MSQTTTTRCSCGCHSQARETPAPNAWLTPDEVVAYLRGAVKLGTLRNYRSARIGPRYLKVGRSIFYTVDSIDDWLAELSATDELRWNDRL